MSKNYNRIKKLIYIVTAFLIFVGTMHPVEGAAEFLTEEEKEYIVKSSVIRAASVNGAAPISFTDSNGEQGISKRVLDEISSRTGLVFDFTVYDSVEEVLASDAHIIYGISPTYAPENMQLSQPFLRSVTILYMNSSLDVEHLDDKIYAAIEGSDLPRGIKKDKVIYFETREESLDAVEKGIVDYGYGNAYSVAYYTMRNGYKNVVTIPQIKEPREYCIGLLHGDEILLSIINKAINTIDEVQMQALVLDVASHIDRRITLGMIMDAYGKRILLTIFAIISILFFNVISNIKTKNRLKIQNKRYEVLSQISNEYFYEYQIKNKQLKLSEKFNEIFGYSEELNAVKRILNNHLLNVVSEKNNSIVKLTLINGKEGVFKVISTRIFNDKGKADSIIGKLIDISEEAAERETLLTKSQIDGLTGLYNASTAKEYITEKISRRKKQAIDAFILIDCDDFKNINDTYGHLIGDKVLEDLAKILKLTFRNTDIIGRIGGDEFCVYLTDILSMDVAKEKCRQINIQLKEIKTEVNLSVSIGVAMVNDMDTYEDVFIKADTALYEAKNNGKAQFLEG